MSKSTAPILLERLYDLYFSEKKPAELLPIDLALLSYLILRQTETHFIHDSQDTLAVRLACNRKTISRAIERLEQLKLISVKRDFEWNPKTHRKTRTMYAPLGLSVNLDALPKRTKKTSVERISEEAKELALEYENLWVQLNRGYGKYKRLPKNWKRHTQESAQRFIDACNGDSELALDVLNFAVMDEEYQPLAKRGLYHVVRSLKRIRKDYDEEQEYQKSGQDEAA